MRNASVEFSRHIQGKSRVLCAQITNNHYSTPRPTDYNLPKGYTDEQFHDFLESLNFDYDSGFGSQYLFGYIWYEDGTWSSRGEYDGSEWWDYNKIPEIPTELGVI